MIFSTEDEKAIDTIQYPFIIRIFLKHLRKEKDAYYLCSTEHPTDWISKSIKE